MPEASARDPVTVLAFDFGLKYIGVAVGQSLTKDARGVATLKANDGKPQWRQIRALLADYEPNELVVGQPLNMDGSDSAMAERAAAFAQELERRMHLPTHLHDERLTSYEANEAFDAYRAGGHADTPHEVAALLIARSFLEHQR